MNICDSQDEIRAVSAHHARFAFTGLPVPACCSNPDASCTQFFITSLLEEQIQWEKKDFRANTTPCTWAGPSLMPICTTQILSQKQGQAFTNRFLTATLAQDQVHFEVMALNVFQFCRFQRYSLFDSKQQWQTTLLGLLILLRAHYSLLLPTLGFVCFKNQTDLGCFFF